MAVRQVTTSIGLHSREKELEDVLDLLRRYSTGSTVRQEDLFARVRWLLDVWDAAMGKSGQIVAIGESFLHRITSSGFSQGQNNPSKALYLCLSPLAYFIIGLEELIDDAFRDAVTRCGMFCERIVHELLRLAGRFDMLEANVKFSNKVGALQNFLSIKRYRAAEHLCATILTVYDIRNQRGPHDVPTADELEAKFCVSSFPWVYARYLEILDSLGYDLSDNMEKFIGLCNSIVRVGTSLAKRAGHEGLFAREAVEILLYKNGFFLEERSLGDVIVELGRLGYNYPKPTVANTLESLTKTFLSRHGRPGVFRYHQKIPPHEYYKTST